MVTKIVKCPNCSAENTGLASFCRNCGNTLPDGNLNQQFYRDQQIQRHSSTGSLPGADKKILAGVFGILLGGIGIHKFIIGYNREGIIMLSSQLISWILAIASCGMLFFLPFLVCVVGFVEGVVYLTKSDEEFVQTYITDKKPWF